MKREHETHAKVEALLNYLELTGVLEPDWRKALQRMENHDKAKEAIRRTKQGEGPPEWANNREK